MGRENPYSVSIQVVTSCQAIQPKRVMEEADPEESWMEFFLRCEITGCTVDDHIVCGGGPIWREAHRKAELTEKIGDLIDGGNVKIVKGHYAVRINSRSNYLKCIPKERRTPPARLLDNDDEGPPAILRPWVPRKAAKKRPDPPVLHYTPRRKAPRAARRQPEAPVLHSPPRRQAPRTVRRQPEAPVLRSPSRRQAPRTVRRQREAPVPHSPPRRQAPRTFKKRQVAMTRSHHDTGAARPLEPAPPERQMEDDDDLEVEDPPTNRRQDPASGRRSPAPSATRSGGGNASGRSDDEIISWIVDVNGAVAMNPPPAAGRPVRLASLRPYGGGAQDVSVAAQRVVRRERRAPRNWKPILQQRLAPFSNGWLLRVAEETKGLQDNHLWLRNVAHMPYSCQFLQDLLEL